MRGSETLRGKDIITDTNISDRLDYLAFLDDSDMSDDDKDLWADEIEELATLRELVEKVGDEHSGLISENYWREYTVNEADDLYDLEKTGAYRYFGYDAYADDMQTEYSQVDFMGTTYYYQE